MKLESLKNSLDSFWGNLSEGWRQLWTSTSAAITSFHPGEKTNLPAHSDIDDHLYLPGRSWSVLGGDAEVIVANKSLLALENPIGNPYFAKHGDVIFPN